MHRIEVAEGQHLDVLQQIGNRRQPAEQRGMTTIVRASSGTRPDKSRRRSRRGGIVQATARCTRAMAMSSAKIDRSSDHGHRRHFRGAGAAQVERHRIQQQPGDQRRWAPDRRTSCGRTPGGASTSQRRPIPEIRLEAATSAADEVVTDVRGPIGGRSSRRRLARALDGAQGDPHLRLSASPAPVPQSPGAGDRGSGNPCGDRRPPGLGAGPVRPG